MSVTYIIYFYYYYYIIILTKIIVNIFILHRPKRKMGQDTINNILKINIYFI